MSILEISIIAPSYNASRTIERALRSIALQTYSNYEIVIVDDSSKDNTKGLDSYIDLQFMSLCKHHVIANSSFSWRGAWLNLRAEKIVIAPRVWFRNGNNDSDLIPSEWVGL